MRILVTGAAGFIGAEVARGLLKRGDEVLGIDNLNDYYDVSLKEARLNRLKSEFPGFKFQRADVADREGMARLFAEIKPQRVAHMAAQAGVRYSVTHPYTYLDSNLQGYLHILEGCRHQKVEHLVYASSSSVYGATTHLPYSVHQAVDHPVSLYAATKKSNELMAHAYSHLYKIPTTGLRFFTVYGPWGRPDMAPFIFAKNILAGKPIDVFNDGHHLRDFTYIDDIAEGVIRVINRPATPDDKWDSRHPDPATSTGPYRIYNIGHHAPISLMSFIEALERAFRKKAVKVMKPMAAGDMLDTHADIAELERDFDFRPQVSLDTGLEKFARWYREYYSLAA